MASSIIQIPPVSTTGACVLHDRVHASSEVAHVPPPLSATVVQVAWGDEKECFQTVAAALAEFYALGLPEADGDADAGQPPRAAAGSRQGAPDTEAAEAAGGRRARSTEDKDTVGSTEIEHDGEGEGAPTKRQRLLAEDSLGRAPQAQRRAEEVQPSSGDKHTAASSQAAARPRYQGAAGMQEAQGGPKEVQGGVTGAQGGGRSCCQESPRPPRDASDGVLGPPGVGTAAGVPAGTAPGADGAYGAEAVTDGDQGEERGAQRGRALVCAGEPAAVKALGVDQGGPAELETGASNAPAQGAHGASRLAAGTGKSSSGSSVNAQYEWQVQQILLPALRFFLRAPKHTAQDGTVVKVSGRDLEYRAFCTAVKDGHHVSTPST